MVVFFKETWKEWWANRHRHDNSIRADRNTDLYLTQHDIKHMGDAGRYWRR